MTARKESAKITHRKSESHLTYKESGVDIKTADAAKETIAKFLRPSDNRVLNRVGAFASLFEARFPGYTHPVLVLKAEEPGSKQLLAFKYDRVEEICRDMIAHLINDIVVMGAQPLAVLDVIVCGKLQKQTIVRAIQAISEACKEQDCELVGGETSEQPDVLPNGGYVLSASVVGVVERSLIIDGSKIMDGDSIIALGSSGPHTNGFTLIRKLLYKNPSLAHEEVGPNSFIDAVMSSHICYRKPLKEIMRNPELHGLAHITGGGIRDNLERILPPNLDALIDLDAIRILPVFSRIRSAGKVSETEMLHTFNLGVGMIVVSSSRSTDAFIKRLRASGLKAYPLGNVVQGNGRVRFRRRLQWQNRSRSL